MNESRFTYESMTECISAAEQEAQRSGLSAPKYAKLARSMRNAYRKAEQNGELYIYYRFPSHRIAREFRGYTVGY